MKRQRNQPPVRWAEDEVTAVWVPPTELLEDLRREQQRAAQQNDDGAGRGLRFGRESAR